jgi:hypothetical protein
MPLLDVTSVLLDPDFAEPVTVLRRRENNNDYGEVEISEERIPVIGVVTSGGSPLERRPDGQIWPYAITVHTIFRLIGPSRDGDRPAGHYQPDVVLWNGARYLVHRLSDYSNFGAGFVSADCTALPFEGVADVSAG